MLVSLSALPAMLTSPLLRAALLPLARLQAAEAPAPACGMPALCHVTLATVQSISVRCAACLQAWQVPLCFYRGGQFPCALQAGACAVPPAAAAGIAVPGGALP